MRNGILVLLVLFACAISANGQDTQVKPRPWTIGMSGSADYCFRTLVKNEESTIVDYLLASREDMEAPRISFSIGFDVCRDLGKHFILATGLQYSDRGYGTKEDGWPLTDVNGTYFGKVTYAYHYTFLSLPVLLRYKLGNGKFRFEPALGFSADMGHERYVKYDLEFADGTTDTDRSGDSESEHDDAFLTAISELGMSMRISERTSLRMALRGRYQMNQLYNSPISAHLYDTGLLFGFAVRI